MIENNRYEYKRELSDSLEKEVVAFLNYKDGGELWIGIDKKGHVYGTSDADGLQLQVKDRLRNNIQPSIMGLFDIIHEKRNGLDVVRILVASGPEKPYYRKQYGMTPKGCSIRVGSASEPMPQEMIDSLYGRRVRNTIGRMESTRLGLTFAQLKIYYETRGLSLNGAFLQNLELLTAEGKPNYAAYLLADENGVSIQVAKYRGITRDDLMENRDYGKRSLITALKEVLSRMDVENTIYTRIGKMYREERPMIDPRALREAVMNAIVHNDYSNGASPKFEFFIDRLEITSAGGLPYGVESDDFFTGYSSPRNKEIMRVFRDLELVEHLGSGVPRILEKYDRNAFTLNPNYLRITFPYAAPFHQEPELVDGLVGGLVDGLVESQQQILELVSKNPKISKREMAERIGISTTAIDKNIETLKNKDLLTRIGSNKSGHWEVKKDMIHATK